MNIPLLALISAAVLLFAYTSKRIIPGKSGKQKKPQPLRKEPDFNEKFIENSEGRTALKFLRVYSPVDLAILRSLLDSEGIETYTEFESLNRLFPGVRVPGHTDTIISIFEDKREEAVNIVSDYISALKENETQRIKDMLRNIGEYSIGGYAVPSNQNRIMPEILDE